MFKNRPNQCVYISRSVAVVGAVFLLCKDKMYILITRRAEHMPDEPNRWCLPCGYLDWDETIYEATIREIYEETHLDLNLAYKMHAYPEIHIDSTCRNEKQNVSVVSAFLIESDEFPDLELTNETNAVAWCATENVHDKNLTFGHQEVVVRASIEVLSKMHLD